MQDDLGLAWKLSFGALVLAFCALVIAVRKPPVVSPVPAHGAAVIKPLPLIELPMREAAAKPDAEHQAPLDAAEPPPVRIEVSLFEPLPVPRPAIKPHPAPRPHVNRESSPAKIKPSTAHRTAGAQRARPVAVVHIVRGPHYPFNPRERRTGEQEFAPGRS